MKNASLTSTRNKNFTGAYKRDNTLSSNYTSMYMKDNIRKNRPENIISNLKKKDEKMRENMKRTALSLSPKKKNEEEFCLLPPRTRTSEKKTLVLDLDETLVHSTFDEIDNPDLIIQMDIDEVVYDIYVLIRPGALDFIEEVSKLYEIVIFTASMSKYADPLISQLDINRRCQYRLFREHCTYMDGVYVKDMSKMGRSLKNIIIIDNSPLCYSLQQNNGIPIKSWFDEKDDRELFRLLPILNNLSGFYDVRTEIPKFVTNNTLIWARAIRWVEENYILISNTDNITAVNLKASERSNSNSNYIHTDYGSEETHLSRNYQFNCRVNNYTQEDDFKETQTIIHSSQEGKNKIYKIGNNQSSSHNKHNRYKQIINQPNININIINGSYNKIVLTEGNEVQDSQDYKSIYRKINTGINTSESSPHKQTQSPTQHIISDLKNYNDIIHKQITPKKVGLYYNMCHKKKSAGNNINIIDDNKVNIQDLPKKTPKNYIKDSGKKENLIYDSGIRTTQSSLTEKELQANIQLYPNRNKNSLNLYKVKTNFSSFLKNNTTLYNPEKLKFNNYTNLSNVNNSYQKSTENQSFFNINKSHLTNTNSRLIQPTTNSIDFSSNEPEVPNHHQTKTRNNINSISNNTNSSASKLNLAKLTSNVCKSREKNRNILTQSITGVTGQSNSSANGNSSLLKKMPSSINRKSSLIRHSYNLPSKTDTNAGETYYIKTESDINEPVSNGNSVVNPVSLNRNKIPSSTKHHVPINHYPDYSKLQGKLINLKFPIHNSKKLARGNTSQHKLKK